MYLSSDDKLNDGEQVDQLAGDPNLDPTAQSGQSSTGTGQNQQSGVVNPGSVGGSTGTGAQGGTPAWTNIQSYLNANPQTSPAVSGFGEKADKTVDATRSQFEDYMKSREGFEQGQQTASYVDDFNTNTMGNHLRSQMSGKPSNSYATVNNVNQFMNQDYGNMGFQQYQPNQDYQQLQSIAETPEGFQSYVNDSYDEAAGRQLTGGQRALQNQIDLSGGAFADVRQTALDKLAGVQGMNDQAAALNENYGADMQQINDMQQRANQMRNQYKSSNDLYTRKFGEGRWDPGAQRAGETAFATGVANPIKNLTRDFYDQIISQEAPGWSHAQINNARPDMAGAYNAIMSGVNNRNPDDYADQMRTLANIAASTGNSHDQVGFRHIANQMRSTYNNWMKNNEQLYQDTYF